MRSTSRMPVWASILAGATAAGLLAVAGCTLDKPENQPKQLFNRIGGRRRRPGPRAQAMPDPRADPRPAVPRPGDQRGGVADGRRTGRSRRPSARPLEANGLRHRPHHRRAAQGDRDDPPGGGPEQAQGRPVEHPARERRVDADQHERRGSPQVSLLVNRDDRVSGRDYQDASGYLRLTPRHHGAHAVSLRVVPEIQHGPVQRSFPACPTPPASRPGAEHPRCPEGGGPQRAGRGPGARGGPGRRHRLPAGEPAEPGHVPVQPDSGRERGSTSAAGPDLGLAQHDRGRSPRRPRAAIGPKLFRRLVVAPDEPPANPAPPDPAPPPIPPPPDPTPRPSAAASSGQARPAGKDRGPSSTPQPLSPDSGSRPSRAGSEETRNGARNCKSIRVPKSKDPDRSGR